MSERAVVILSENLNIEGSRIPFYGNSNSSLADDPFLRRRTRRAAGHANVAKLRGFEAPQQCPDEERAGVSELPRGTAICASSVRPVFGIESAHEFTSFIQLLGFAAG